MLSFFFHPHTPPATPTYPIQPFLKFSNWAQSVHDPLDPPNNALPCIRSVDQLLDFISVIETSPGLSRYLLGPATWECDSGQEGNPAEVKDVRVRWIDQVPGSLGP